MAALLIVLSNLSYIRRYDISRGNGEQAHGLVNLANAAISVTYRRDGKFQSAFGRATVLSMRTCQMQDRVRFEMADKRGTQQ